MSFGTGWKPVSQASHLVTRVTRASSACIAVRNLSKIRSAEF